MSGFIFNEKPIEIVDGDDVTLTDSKGNEYLDFGASYACVPLGHGHDAVLAATHDQLDRLTYVQASYPNPVRTELYEKLAAVAPGDLNKTWLCNSGTEANEAALKFARSATGNTKFVAAMQAFHGRTMGSLSITWKDKYKKHYEPLLDDVEFVPYDDGEALAEAVDDDTAGVILEPIQGEGGINSASVEYLETAREVTDAVGAALIFDEVQTGLGRTGSLWACEDAGVVPDVLTSAKGLGNGFPVGATLCRDWIADEYGNHASTFSGGPVVSAAANATVETIVEDDLPGHAAEMGDLLQTRLQETVGEDVREIRGRGLMVGVEVGRGANRILKELALNHGVLALPAGRTVVRLLPPLTVDEDDVETVVNAIAETIR
ncbi:MAG: aspartate aminotransferase family protein [Haloarculaceae archaeon]